VASQDPHAQQRGELSRIDYFLDQLARAVERGEVPRASYDTLAPRYLARRAELVAVLTGGTVVREPRNTGPTLLGQAGTASVESPVHPGAPASAPARRSASLPAPRRQREPVRWTTVLLFLGAFLVIVASAIFALVVWDIAAPAFKLAFMGALTVAFYAAGNHARKNLGLKAGGTALTVVGSAMLLFDCWIVIDGFDLQSVSAWAVALLVCSLVYWFTEIRLGERFYGIAGAAAQVGWWWLLGTGMHLEYPLRIAGVAAVALLWQLTAERVRGDSQFASLADVLVRAAPAVQAIAVLALIADLITVGTPDALTFFAAAVASAAGAVVFLRTRLVLPNRPVLAAIAQLPLLLAALLAAENPAWWLVASLAVMAAAYALTSIFIAGTPFAILALTSEFVLVGAACDLLGASAHVTAVVFAALAVTWALVSRLLSSKLGAPTSDDVSVVGPAGAGRASDFSRVASVGSVVLLIWASSSAVGAGAGPALSGVRIGSADVLASAGVLIAWALATLATRRARDAVGTSLWSLYSLAALLAWAAPGLQSALYATALLAACATWFSARKGMARFYRVDGELFGWLYRGLAGLIVLGGLGAQAFYFGGDPLWTGAILLVAAAAFFAADAALDGPSASAVVAGVAGTGAAFLAGHALSVASTPKTGALAVLAASPATLAAVTAAGGAALLATAGALLRRWFEPRSGQVALSAAAFATVLSAYAIEEPSRAAAAFALLAIAWVAAAVALRAQPLAGIAGLSAFASALALVAAADGSPWLTVVVAGIACILLNAPAFVRPLGPGSEHARVGLSFSAAGLVGVVGLIALGAPYALSLASLEASGWLAFGQHEVAVLLAIAGAVVLAQGVRWKAEAALYVGFGVLLLALFAEMSALSLATAELYSTPLALYLIAMGYLYAWRVPGRGVPLGLDIGALLVGLGVPLSGALSGWGPEAFSHTAWAIGLSLAFIAGGIGGRVRAYLFGGTGALALVAAWRTMTYLAEFWWLVLGLIGMAMLVIALTWERQRMMLSETQQRLRDSLEHWR